MRRAPDSLPVPPDRRLVPFLLCLLPPAGLFCLAALHLVQVPGVYMDAVNPDYMAVHILHPSAKDLSNWATDDVLIAGRYPVIVKIYHGALPLYVGLPIYWLLGTGIEGIRVANAWFGLLVLAGSLAFLRAWDVRPIVIVCVLSALALDPGFVFIWRTQFYITALPLPPSWPPPR